MDIFAVFTNSFTQIIFFLVNVSVIPWICSFVIEKWGEGLHPVLNKVVIVPTSWTVNLICDCLAIPVLWLTGNHPHPEFAIEDRVLNIYTLCDNEKQRWYRPIQQLGSYFNNTLWIVLPMAMSVGLFRILLPETFGVVSEGIGRWTALSSGVTNADYFVEMGGAFVDIIWYRFFLSAINENVLSLIVLITLFIFIFSSRFVFYYDESGNRMIPMTYWPAFIVAVLAFNFIFAAVNPASYATVSHSINSVGIILALVLVLAQVANIVEFCFKGLINMGINLVNKIVRPA